MAAVYLNNNSWVLECVMSCFTEDVLAMYKKVMRFLYGLLSDRASCLILIISLNLIPDPMSQIGFPLVHRLEYLTNIIDVSDWGQFAQDYLLNNSIKTLN